MHELVSLALAEVSSTDSDGLLEAVRPAADLALAIRAKSSQNASARPPSTRYYKVRRPDKIGDADLRAAAESVLALVEIEDRVRQELESAWSRYRELLSGGVK